MHRNKPGKIGIMRCAILRRRIRILLSTEQQLAEAVWNGKTKHLSRLISDGADVNAADANGVTPLARAAWSGQTEALQLLLQAGAAAGINHRDKEEGITALHAAVIVCREIESYLPPLFLQLSSMRPDWREMYRILSIGLPQALEVGGIWLIQIYVLRIISSLGDAAVGAHNIAIRIESLSFLPGFAIGMAGATLVGQYLGTGSARMALATVRKCVLYSVVFMGAMGVVFYLFPEFFGGIFAGNSRELLDAVVPVVQVFLIAEPFYAAMLIIKMCLRGAGYTRRVMLVSFGCMGFFRFLCLVVWNALWPESITLVGIWILITVDMAVEYLLLTRMLHGLKWTRKRV